MSHNIHNMKMNAEFQSSSSGLGTTGIGLGIGPVLGTTASSPVGLQLTPGDSPPGGIPTILGATSLGTSIEPLQTGGIGGNGTSSILPPGGIGVGVKPPSPEQPLFICPRRPNIGREGRAILLRANHFQITMPRGYIHHYHIAISPDKCPRKVNRDIIATMVNAYNRIFGTRKPVFDGRSNLYVREPLPIGNEQVDLEVTLPGEGRDRVFRVAIKWVAQVSLYALEEALEGNDYCIEAKSFSKRRQQQQQTFNVLNSKIYSLQVVLEPFLLMLFKHWM